MSTTKTTTTKKANNIKKTTSKNEVVIIPEVLKQENQTPEILEIKPFESPKIIETIGSLGIFSFHTGVLKPSLNATSVKPQLILDSMEGGVLDRKKCNYTGKQILNTVCSILPTLSTSEVFVYPDAVSFPNRVMEKKFPDEIQADLNVPISQTCFNRFIARVDIAQMPEGKLSFCMKFDGEKGVLEASIGYNHTICSNYTIFSKNDIKTLGREFDYNDFRRFIEELQTGESYLIDQYGNRIQELIEKQLTRNDYLRVLGSAYNQAAKVSGSIQYNNLNMVTQKNVQTKIENGWDLLNAFTLGTRIDTGKGHDNLMQLATTCEFVLENI